MKKPTYHFLRIELDDETGMDIKLNKFIMSGEEIVGLTTSGNEVIVLLKDMEND